MKSITWAKQVAISHESYSFLIVASSRECKWYLITYKCTYNNTHRSLWININSDESCFGGPLITCLSQEMHFGWVSERIHNHFWSFCTRVDVAKRMNHILLKEIQEFLQERLFAKSIIKTFIIFIVATNHFHFIASSSL